MPKNTVWSYKRRHKRRGRKSKTEDNSDISDTIDTVHQASNALLPARAPGMSPEEPIVSVKQELMPLDDFMTEVGILIDQHRKSCSETAADDKSDSNASNIPEHMDVDVNTPHQIKTEPADDLSNVSSTDINHFPVSSPGCLINCDTQSLLNDASLNSHPVSKTDVSTMNNVPHASSSESETIIPNIVIKQEPPDDYEDNSVEACEMKVVNRFEENSNTNVHIKIEPPDDDDIGNSNSVEEIVSKTEPRKRSAAEIQKDLEILRKKIKREPQSPNSALGQLAEMDISAPHDFEKCIPASKNKDILSSEQSVCNSKPEVSSDESASDNTQHETFSKEMFKYLYLNTEIDDNDLEETFQFMSKFPVNNHFELFYNEEKPENMNRLKSNQRPSKGNKSSIFMKNADAEPPKSEKDSTEDTRAKFGFHSPERIVIRSESASCRNTTIPLSSSSITHSTVSEKNSHPPPVSITHTSHVPSNMQLSADFGFRSPKKSAVDEYVLRDSLRTPNVPSSSCPRLVSTTANVFSDGSAPLTNLPSSRPRIMPTTANVSLDGSAPLINLPSSHPRIIPSTTNASSDSSAPKNSGVTTEQLQEILQALKPFPGLLPLKLNVDKNILPKVGTLPSSNAVISNTAIPIGLNPPVNIGHFTHTKIEVSADNHSTTACNSNAVQVSRMHTVNENQNMSIASKSHCNSPQHDHHNLSSQPNINIINEIDNRTEGQKIPVICSFPAYRDSRNLKESSTNLQVCGPDVSTASNSPVSNVPLNKELGSLNIMNEIGKKRKISPSEYGKRLLPRDPRTRKSNDFSESISSPVVSSHVLRQLQNDSVGISDRSNSSSASIIENCNNVSTPDRQIFTAVPNVNILADRSDSMSYPSTSFANRDPRITLPIKSAPCMFLPRQGKADTLLFYKHVGKVKLKHYFPTLILQWNPDWMRVQDATGQYAPICDIYTIAKECYNDIAHYYNTYTPLHLLSIWLKLCEIWKRQNCAILKCTCDNQEDKSTYVRIVFSTELGLTDIWPKREDILLCKTSKEEFFLRVVNVMSKPKLQSENRKVKIECHATISLDLRCGETISLYILFNVRVALLQNDAFMSPNSDIEGLVLRPVDHKQCIKYLKLDPNKPPKELRNEILSVIQPKETRVALIDTPFRCDIVLLITLVAYYLMKNEFKVLICMKNEDSFHKLVKRLWTYKPVLAVRTKEIDLEEEHKKYTLEERMKNHKNPHDILNTYPIFITTFSAFNPNEGNALSKHKIICIVDEAHLCTEAETALLLTHQIQKLLLMGDPMRTINMPLILKKYRYSMSLFQRLLECKKE